MPSLKGCKHAVTKQATQFYKVGVPTTANTEL